MNILHTHILYYYYYHCVFSNEEKYKKPTGEGAGGPVYDVPTINKEQQIIDTQLNTAYGQISTSLQ